jgi:hypothetical protein
LAVAVVFRRTEQSFIREIDDGIEEVIPLGELRIEFPLAEIYDGVEFAPESDDDAR